MGTSLKYTLYTLIIYILCYSYDVLILTDAIAKVKK
jgi:hypothetical protein